MRVLLYTFICSVILSAHSLGKKALPKMIKNINELKNAPIIHCMTFWPIDTNTYLFKKKKFLWSGCNYTDEVLSKNDLIEIFSSSCQTTALKA